MKTSSGIDIKIVLRWVLGLLLIWAAVTKIANLNEFYLSIVLYQLPLPDTFVRLTAMVLPWLEFLCGIFLLTGPARQAALLWSAILFAIFVLITGQAWMRGLNISCGCFKLEFLGAQASAFFESVQVAFFRAGLLLAAAIFLFRTERSAHSTASKDN